MSITGSGQLRFNCCCQFNLPSTEQANITLAIETRAKWFSGNSTKQFQIELIE